MKNRTSFVVAIVACLGFGEQSKADILAIQIDPDSLPYDLSPNTYDNRATTYENRSTTYENRETTYENRGSTYENRPSTYGNGKNGDRRVVSEDREYLGYYVFSENGVVNFFSESGDRVAYMPAGGHTQSVFLSDGGWCGTIGKQGRSRVLGLSRNCMLRFLLD